MTSKVPPAPGLKRWAHEKPLPGRSFILYEPWDEEPMLVEYIDIKDREPFFSVVKNGLELIGDACISDCIDLPISDRAQWCYVPGPPDWSADYEDGEEVWNKREEGNHDG